MGSVKMGTLICLCLAHILLSPSWFRAWPCGNACWRGHCISYLGLLACVSMAPGKMAPLQHFRYKIWPCGAGLKSSQLAPKSVFSCLTVLLEGAIHGMMPLAQPQSHERCLAILGRLASSPDTRRPTLEVLRTNGILLQQLNDVGCAPLAAEADQVTTSSPHCPDPPPPPLLFPLSPDQT